MEPAIDKPAFFTYERILLEWLDRSNCNRAYCSKNITQPKKKQKCKSKPRGLVYTPDVSSGGDTLDFISDILSLSEKKDLRGITSFAQFFLKTILDEGVDEGFKLEVMIRRHGIFEWNDILLFRHDASILWTIFLRFIRKYLLPCVNFKYIKIVEGFYDEKTTDVANWTNVILDLHPEVLAARDMVLTAVLNFLLGFDHFDLSQYYEMYDLEIDVRAAAKFGKRKFFSPRYAYTNAIEQYDIITGRIFHRYPTTKSAAINMQSSARGIAECCKGIKSEHDGFGYRYYRGPIIDCN